jgi:hypothetical protein
MADEENKGYRVEDRRFIFREEQEKAAGKQADEKAGEEAAAEAKPEEPSAGEARPEGGAEAQTGAQAGAEAQAHERREARRGPLPHLSFSTFVFSLNSSALIHLGDYPDPVSGQVEPDLDLAKQTVDLLGLLKEKTRGNLTKEEEQLLDAILFDLRMRYVKLKG